MSHISLTGIFLSLIMFILFIVELIKLLQSFNRGRAGNIPVHILGVISAGIITVFTVTTSFNIEIGSNKFILITVIIAAISFIVLGFDSLMVNKPQKLRVNKYKERELRK